MFWHFALLENKLSNFPIFFPFYFLYFCAAHSFIYFIQPASPIRHAHHMMLVLCCIVCPIPVHTLNVTLIILFSFICIHACESVSENAPKVFFVRKRKELDDRTSICQGTVFHVVHSSSQEKRKKPTSRRSKKKHQRGETYTNIKRNENKRMEKLTNEIYLPNVKWIQCGNSAIALRSHHILCNILQWICMV